MLVKAWILRLTFRGYLQKTDTIRQLALEHQSTSIKSTQFQVLRMGEEVKI
jgi:hypothetical protein